VKKANTKWRQENETGALLFFVQDRGDEFIAAKHFDIVHEGNHGIVVKIMKRNMLKDFLGNIWGSDDFDLGVARFRVPGAHTSGTAAMDGIAGVAGSAQIADFRQEAILDGIVANNDDPFHEHCLHR
jgi:hypothetical protein